MIHLRSPLGIGCLLALALPACAAGTDPSPNDDATVVVTATRTSTPLEQVASSLSVITARQLEATHQSFVADALREVPGVYVSQSGGPGHFASVFLRGASAGSTLVLIDGVEVNDTSSPDRAFDFANLTVDNIERIEVLRGPQSTLYGSDAMAGVINILTRHGSGKPSSTLTLEGGRYGTGKAHLSTQGSVKAWRYSASAGRYVTNGFPLADLQIGNTHNDGYRSTTLSGRADRRLSDTFSFDVVGRYVKGKASLAGFPPPDYLLADEGIHTGDTEQKTVRAEARWRPGKGKLENLFGLSANMLNRDSFDAGAGQPAASSNFNGRTYKIDWQANYDADARNLITLGAERERDDAEYTSPGDSSPARHVLNTGYYAQDQITLRPGWFATLGVRGDDYEPFGTHGTYRLTSSYRLPGTGARFKATYGTGFKAPSLFDLYDPNYGNALLRPEESRSYDIGIEQSIDQGRGAVSATYFHNDYHNLIGFDANFVAQNIETAHMHGIEVVASYKPLPRLHFDLNYTYTRSEGTGGKPLPRRPKSLYSASVGYVVSPHLDLNLNGISVSSRLDTAAFPPVTLPSYIVLNTALTYRISPAYSAFLRIDNILNKHYEEVYAYRTASRGIYGGLTSSF